MEQEDIERQMNELDMLLEGSVVHIDPPVERLNPQPLNYGTPGQVLTTSGNTPVWVNASSSTITWNHPNTAGYSQWITPGQINPVTGEEYNLIDFTAPQDTLKSSWLYEPTKKDLPYNFFTSLTLIKTPDDKVELSKRLREKQARKKLRYNDNGDSEISN